ncbi:MAG: glycosyltransferase family 1 protein [Candidatus Roizmanbacteria bacterium]
MIIGIDGNEANVEKQVGVSVYTNNLLSYFSKWANVKIQFVIYLRETPKNHLPKSTEYFRYQVIPFQRLWSQIFLPIYLYTHKRPSVFFSPAHYAPRWCPIPTVVTIHDLAYFLYPEEFLKKDLYQLREWTRYSVDQSTHLIAVSKTTKKDLIRYYNIQENKISIVYNGFEKQIKEDNATIDKHILNKWNIRQNEYILFVSTIQPRKNLINLLKAYSELKKQSVSYNLVIVGKKGWLYKQIFEDVKTLNLEEHVIFTDYVSDDELVELYKHALCLVFPSLYEGFGIPILEAMSWRCPVITSFASSLPEVGGDACLYIDPENPQDISEKISHLIDNNSLRNKLIEKGLERTKNFSWEKCAQETLEVLQQFASIT